MTRQSAVSWIRRLNRHYGLNIRLRMPNIDAMASADISRGCIRLAKLEPLYDPRVIAHEYAHFLQCSAGQVPRFSQAPHNKRFEAIYAECCLVLGMLAIPTEQLRQQKMAEICQLEKENGGTGE